MLSPIPENAPKNWFNGSNRFNIVVNKDSLYVEAHLRSIKYQEEHDSGSKTSNSCLVDYMDEDEEDLAFVDYVLQYRD